MPCRSTSNRMASLKIAFSHASPVETLKFTVGRPGYCACPRSREMLKLAGVWPIFGGQASPLRDFANCKLLGDKFKELVDSLENSLTADIAIVKKFVEVVGCGGYEGKYWWRIFFSSGPS